MTQTQTVQTTQVYQVLIKASAQQIWDAIVWGDEVIIESDPPHRLVVPWRSMYDDEMANEPRSRVTWQIDERDGGVCLLTAKHDQLENSPKIARSVNGIGWTTVLSGMKTLVETGRPLFEETA